MIEPVVGEWVSEAEATAKHASFPRITVETKGKARERSRRKGEPRSGRVSVVTSERRFRVLDGP